MRISYNDLAKIVGCEYNTARNILCRSEFSHIKLHRGYCYLSEEEIEAIKTYYINRHKKDKNKKIKNKKEENKKENLLNYSYLNNEELINIILKKDKEIEEIKYFNEQLLKHNQMLHSRVYGKEKEEVLL